MHKKKSILKFIVIFMIAIGGLLLIKALNNKTYRSMRMLIVGDSIGEGAGASDPANKWYKYLVPYMKEKYGVNLEIENVSLGGNTSFAGYTRIMQLDADKDYDFVIVCYGQNDNAEEFSFYYESILRALYWKYPGCKLITILESSQREYTPKMQMVQQLSAHYGAEVVDMIGAFQESSYSYEELCDDGVHPNDQGQIIYYQEIKQAVEYYMDLSEDGVALCEIEAVDPMVEEMKKFHYYGIKDLYPIDELTYELEVDEKYGILGMDYSTIKGENNIFVYLDYTLEEQKDIAWTNDFSLRYIEVVTRGYIDPHTIMITFSSEQQKESFHGIVLCGEPME